MFGIFFEWINDKEDKIDKKVFAETPKGTEEIMRQMRLEHEEEVSSENPYYFSETTSDRKYYD